jgi:hypothetical protein
VQRKKKRGRQIDVRTRKRREKIISAGAKKGAGEKKILFGRERKKKIIRAGAKKNSDVNENTTHKKAR